MFQRRPTRKAVVVRNDMLRVGELSRAGTKLPNRSGVAQLCLVQELFGLVLEVFEIRLGG
jgi:hypothetical protein